MKWKQKKIPNYVIYVVFFPENKNMFQLRMIPNSYFPQKKKNLKFKKKERISIDQKIVKKEEIGFLAKAAILLDNEKEQDRQTEWQRQREINESKGRLTPLKVWLFFSPNDLHNA